jgi:coenzyme PQQ precursor peptide PqqA
LAGGAVERRNPEEDDMAWKKPRVTEVSVAMEINCYACAEA